MEIRSAKHIHGHLVAKGSSCRAWAIERGYNPRTVQLYVQMYAPDTGRSPRPRSLAEEIMNALYEFIGYEQAQKSGEERDNE